jgi:hypothetical protein
VGGINSKKVVKLLIGVSGTLLSNLKYKRVMRIPALAASDNRLGADPVSIAHAET